MSEEKKKASEDKKIRNQIEDLLTRRFFVVPAFEIYQGVGGLYDFGPPGCAMKDNILSYWRQHFVLTENMLEISSTNLTPEIVLKTSGHVDRFTDFMVKDVKTGDCFRADKLLEEHVGKLLEGKGKEFNDEKKMELLAIKTNAGAYSQEELGKKLSLLGVKAPETGNELSEPFAFNLMFGTQIGPTGRFVGYLRPETAQGIFVNFRRLLDYNGGRMPFASAQIGLAFRNEISPRSGLLRVREFTLAEIEHFVHPNNKNHPKFKEVSNVVLTLLSRGAQTGEDVACSITAGDAVAKGIIGNETLAYFMVRTHLFLIAVGVHSDKLRFRQHKSKEMAHYAQDCWDAEVHTTYGWVECVGHADRAAFDLKVHSDASKYPLEAYEAFDKPIEVEVASVKIDKSKVGKEFKSDAQDLMKHLEKLNKEEVLAIRNQLESGMAIVKLSNGKEFKLTKEMISTVFETQKKHGRPYIPNVIEPSFGIGRIMYAVLEHSYVQRDPKDPQRAYLSLPPLVAPIKVAILPMSANVLFDPIIAIFVKGFLDINLPSKVDDSTAHLGRKYARADEIGIPFAVTIDFDTLKDRSVTIRERDSMTQVRVSIEQSFLIVSQLCSRSMAWTKVYDTFTRFIHQEGVDEKDEKQKN